MSAWLSTHLPEQLDSPFWQESAHLPEEQTSPALQVLPQAPQFFTSFCMLTHRLEQLCRPF